MKMGSLVLCCLWGLGSLGFLLGEEAAGAGKGAGDAAGGRIMLAKVRIILNGQVHEWSPQGIQGPEGELPRGFKAGTVLSFTALRPGKFYSPEALEGECERTRYRLEESGYFYEAVVIIVPPRQRPEERTVLIEVTEGFLTRFGGGYAYGMFGRVGLGGERQELRVYGGWSRNGIAYTHHRLGNGPFLLGGSLFYEGPGGEGPLGSPESPRPLEAVLSTGVYGGPDLLGGLRFAAAFPLPPSGAGEYRPLWSIGPYLSYGPILGFTRRKQPVIGHFDAEGSWYPGFPGFTALGAAALRIPLFSRLEWAALGSAGGSFGDTPAGSRFDLYRGLDLNGREAGILRSPEPAGGAGPGSRPGASSFVLASMELRIRAAAFTLARAVPVELFLFPFIDLAFYSTGPGADTAAEAYGAAARLYFAAPVFAWFHFSYGWDREGRGRFVFSGSAGF